MGKSVGVFGFFPRQGTVATPFWRIPGTSFPQVLANLAGPVWCRSLLTKTEPTAHLSFSISPDRLNVGPWNVAGLLILNTQRKGAVRIPLGRGTKLFIRWPDPNGVRPFCILGFWCKLTALGVL